MTARVLKNVKKIHDEASEIDGFEDLTPEDQAKITTAWEEEHVADEDIPDSARKPAKGADDGEEDEEHEDGEKPKKAPRKKKADTEGAAAKPAAKKRGKKPKKVFYSSCFIFRILTKRPGRV